MTYDIALDDHSWAGFDSIYHGVYSAYISSAFIERLDPDQGYPDTAKVKFLKIQAQCANL